MIDAVVVGAGLSGLICARALVRAGKQVVVLEARDRIGGRTLSRSFAGRRIDAGAQWLSQGQPRLRALAAELGVATVPQYRHGRAVIARPDRSRSLLGPFERWRKLRELEKLSHAPSTVDRDLSLGDWLERRVRTASTREMIALAAELETGSSAQELSLFYYLTALRASGGFGAGADDATDDAGQEKLFEGGAQSLCAGLAAELGDRVRTARVVRAVSQSSDAVCVDTDHESLRAAHCVLALPPSLCTRIEVQGRTSARAAIEAHMPNANVVKIFVQYPEPFWRAEGLSGEGYYVGGTVRATVDACGSSTGSHGESAVLLAFIVGTEAAHWAERSAQERRAAVMGDLGTLFGTQATSPIDYLEHDWAPDPWAAGCIGNLRPGRPEVDPQDELDADALRRACGRVHYAGSETAREWPRYLEGAIESGERAAEEIIAGMLAKPAPARTP